MKIANPVTLGLYLTTAATSMIAATERGNPDSVGILRVQIADAAGVLLPSLPTDARGLALWCLKEAEKIVEAITPTRNVVGVLVTRHECLGHPAGPNDPMGQTTYCDGSCRA